MLHSFPLLASDNIPTVIFDVHGCLYKNMQSRCNVAGRIGRIDSFFLVVFCIFYDRFLSFTTSDCRKQDLNLHLAQLTLSSLSQYR